MINIITITYNDSKNLLRTILSVRNRKTEYQKFYIIDGNSDDDTLDIINANLDIIDDYISEPDFGIYNAMNKCLRFNLRDSDYLIWINSGDELLNISNDDLILFNEADCIFFPVITKLNERDIGRLVKPIIKLPYDERRFFPNSFFIHQGFTIKVKLFKSLLYNESVGLQAENLLMSICIKNYRFIYASSPISIYYLDGISSRKNFKILFSYIKVAQILEFSTLKLFYYQFKFLMKVFMKGLIPYSIYSKIRKG